MAKKVKRDEKLLAKAVKVGGLSSKTKTVRAALREFIARRRRRSPLVEFHAIEFAPGNMIEQGGEDVFDPFADVRDPSPGRDVDLST